MQFLVGFSRSAGPNLSHAGSRLWLRAERGELKHTLLKLGHSQHRRLPVREALSLEASAPLRSVPGLVCWYLMPRFAGFPPPVKPAAKGFCLMKETWSQKS